MEARLHALLQHLHPHACQRPSLAGLEHEERGAHDDHCMCRVPVPMPRRLSAAQGAHISSSGQSPECEAESCVYVKAKRHRVKGGEKEREEKMDAT